MYVKHLFKLMITVCLCNMNYSLCIESREKNYKYDIVQFLRSLAITRTNCHAATFWHIYSISHIYSHFPLLNFLTTFSLRMLCLKKPYNMDFFKKFKTKIFIFEYYPKIPLEMNSTHPFYPILIPNTSYVKNFILFVGGPRGSQN